MPSINPHIVVADAARAIGWYVMVFGAAERRRVPIPGGRVMSCELVIGSSTLSVADEFPEHGVVSPSTLGGTPVTLAVDADGVDGVDAMFARAVANGAEVRVPPQDMFWGDYYCQFVDPFGHRWNVSHHVDDVALDDVVRAAAEMFAG